MLAAELQVRLDLLDGAIRKCGISSTSRGSNPIEGASAEVYLCSVTLISLMAGECRVATEVAVANQPKVCRIGAEGVLPLGGELAHPDGAEGRI